MDGFDAPEEEAEGDDGPKRAGAQTPGARWRGGGAGSGRFGFGAQGDTIK